MDFNNGRGSTLEQDEQTWEGFHKAAKEHGMFLVHKDVSDYLSLVGDEAPALFGKYAKAKKPMWLMITDKKYCYWLAGTDFFEREVHGAQKKAILRQAAAWIGKKLLTAP
jgi:hypothetical protein